MPFEQTITIINNSGKIISTGKHLVGIFKEARSAYKEKKESLRQERSSNFRRAHTFNVPRGADYHGPIVEEFDDGRSYNEHGDSYRRNFYSLGAGPAPLYLESGRDRRQSLDDGDRRSHVSSSSRRRRRSHRSSTVRDGASKAGHSEHQPSKPPLTASNLRTLSEISATRPSATFPGRRHGSGPYADPAPRDLALSRLDHSHPPASHVSTGPNSGSPAAALPSPRTSMIVHRPRSDPALSLRARGRSNGGGSVSSSKPIDMNLAYGNIPPDLESRVDLDPGASGDEKTDSQRESEAKSLVDRIESLLNEAQCLHHTAASIMCHLQDNPEAAAAVALTLAELSALLAKLSPAFLGAVKGGSPAVFALLASPQFLIGTSIAVGVTVILFGGWKIIKRISEVRAAREEERLKFDNQIQLQQQAIPGHNLDMAPEGSETPASSPGAYDEALVLEEELSTIESWRRGIEYSQDTGSEPRGGSEVDAELISPEAMRSRIGDDDQRTLRSMRTAKSHSAGLSLRNSRNRRRSKRHGDDTHNGASADSGEAYPDVPERQSSRSHRGVGANDGRDGHRDAAGDTGSTRARRSSSYAGRSRKSRSPSPGGCDAGDAVARSPAPPPVTSTARRKESKKATGSMLKQLFKKKRDKDDKERQEGASSVLV